MSLLVYREFCLLTPVRSPYEVLPLHGMEIRKEHQGIYLGSELIGFNRNVLESLEPPDPEGFELRHTTYMTFLFLGEEREMSVQGTARLNRQLELEEFKIRLASGDHWTDMTGRIAQNRMEIMIEGKETPAAKNTAELEGPVFYSEAVSMIWTPENLRAGKRGHLRVWNPLMMALTPVDFRVSGKVTLAHQGRETEAYVIHLTQNGIETRSWCTPEGVVLKYESPTGLIMIQEEAYKIFDALREKRRDPVDLPNIYSIAAHRPLADPGALKRLKIMLKTPEK